jgi:hypothetical protein
MDAVGGGPLHGLRRLRHVGASNEMDEPAANVVRSLAPP